MRIGKIIGTVVSTQKDERLRGKKLLVVKPINPDGTDADGYVVAVDTVGAGFHEKGFNCGWFFSTYGRWQQGCPVDMAIVGVIDSIDFI